MNEKVPGDWIFSDEYHNWQDDQARGNWRHGTETVLTELGWYYGAFQMKPTNSGSMLDQAKWPEPIREHRIRPVILSRGG